MHQHTILFVDDSPNILRSLQRLFRKMPHRILTAQSGTEALALINGGETPAVIVSDQSMPEMNGAEFLSQAGVLLPDACRIMLTGYSELDAAMDAINRGGIFRYVSKPWNDLDLKNTLEEAVARYELILENKALTEELKNKNAQLEEWNERLEEKVEKRTEALKKTHEQLKIKVKELEGRDRILHHLLEVHTLEDSLKTVMEVIRDMAEMDAVVVYLGESVDLLIPKLGIGLQGSDQWEEEDGLTDLLNRPVHQQVFAKAIDQQTSVRMKQGDVRIKDHVYAVVACAIIPILKGSVCLGVIEMDRRQSHQPILKNEVDMVSSFAMQAAVAIQDSQLQTDLPSLDATLDDVLNDL
jgi:CheY-like chemotaxis protein